MSFLGDFHFLRPAWLLLIPVTLWIWWRVRQLEEPLRGWRAVMDDKLLQALTVGKVNSGNWQYNVLAIFWVVGAIAVAGPTWRPEPSPFADDPTPVMVVLAAGQSMDNSDLLPNRMERARLKVVDFAHARNGQPTGLIVFAGSAHLVLPPTRDTDVIADMAAEIDPSIMPKDGADIMQALQLARQTLGDGGGAIVVVVDQVPANITAESWTTPAPPVQFLAVCHSKAPELTNIRAAATKVGGHTALLTADSQDIERLVASTASAPRAVAASESTRWLESGWWLVPVLAGLALVGFRRSENRPMQETSA